MKARPLAAALAVVLATVPLTPLCARADDAPAIPAPPTAPAQTTGPAQTAAPAQPAAPANTDGAPAGPRHPLIESPDGVPVTFVSKDPAMEIYLAHGDVPARTFPDPFEKVGVVPITLKLSPGQYTIETASAKTSTGHERLTVESNAPVTVEVRGGDAMVKAFGGVFIALGIVATVLGCVAIASISPDDKNYNRWAIGLPLVLGGVGVGGLGVGMTALGSTDIVAPHLPPGGAGRSRAAATWAPTLTARF